MKILLGVIFLLVMSSVSFADSVYVRRSVTEGGVSAADGETVRDIIKNAVTAQGHNLLAAPGKAQWTLRATVGRSDQGPFTVKVERTHRGRVVGANHGSDAKLAEAARLATTNLIEALATSLPEKGNVSTEITSENTSTSDSRVVAANNEVPTAAVEAQHPNYIKNWLVAVGPVVANSLVGSNGTKFAINLSYVLGLSEHFNLQFMYDASFNSGSVGGTSSILGAVGVKYFLFERVSDWSPYAMIDIGYGGGNRANDSTMSFGGTLGVDVFRTQASTYTIYLRNYTLATNNGSSLSNYPNITQFMFGINF
jgi:hypothetical protein